MSGAGASLRAMQKVMSGKGDRVSQVKAEDELQDKKGEAVSPDTNDEKAKIDEEILDASDQGDESAAQDETDPAVELLKAKEEMEQLRDRMLRAAAENENFKKRMERERLASLKYAGETIFKEILPVVDNLERAVSQGVVEGADAATSLKALSEGVELTLKSLVSTLQKFEVIPIDSVGKPFDPKDQEALTMEASAEVAANHVLTEFEKGYYYKDRLLRAAKVVVSSGEPQG